MSLLSWGLYSGRATHKEKGNNAKLSTYDLWRLLAKVLSSVASGVSDSATLWTAAHQAPLSMGFPRQEY